MQKRNKEKKGAENSTEGKKQEKRGSDAEDEDEGDEEKENDTGAEKADKKEKWLMTTEKPKLAQLKPGTARWGSWMSRRQQNERLTEEGERESCGS